MDKRFSFFRVVAAVSAVLSVVFGAQVSRADDNESFVSYTGTATAEHSDRFLYGENHVLRYRDGAVTDRVVLYTCRDGSAFARKTVSYVNRLTPDFELEDASNGMREGVRTEGTVREVFFRGDRAQAEKSSPVPQRPDSVADTGFDAFVRANWQPLMAGKALGMNFLVPSRLEDMSFKVQHIGSGAVDGAPTEIFRLKLSGVLGWALPGIDVYYTASDHVLVRYVGLSDLRDASNDNFKAQIAFHPSDRKVGTEQTLQRARQARLAPCKPD